MQKFIFKLEPLYEYRQRLEEISQKEFAEALQKLNREEAMLNELKDAYRRASGELDSKKEACVEVDQYHIYADYFRSLKSHMDEQERIIRLFRDELETRRVELLEASRSKKVIEKMKEKSFGAFVEDMNRQEQKITDDIVTSRFKRSVEE